MLVHVCAHTHTYTHTHILKDLELSLTRRWETGVSYVSNARCHTHGHRGLALLLIYPSLVQGLRPWHSKTVFSGWNRMWMELLPTALTLAKMLMSWKRNSVKHFIIFSSSFFFFFFPPMVFFFFFFQLENFLGDKLKGLEFRSLKNILQFLAKVTLKHIIWFWNFIWQCVLLTLNWLHCVSKEMQKYSTKLGLHEWCLISFTEEWYTDDKLHPLNTYNTMSFESFIYLSPP